jgi:hypothetical protein
LIWTILGPKTIQLIHENVVSIDIGESIEDLVVSDTRLLEECIKDENKRNRTIIEIEKMLRLRLGNPKHAGSKEFKKLSEKLKELQEKMRQQQIDSIQFLKDLLALAKETLETEQKMEQPEDQHGGTERSNTAGLQGQSGPSDLCTYSSPHGMDTVQYPPSMTKEQDQPPSSRGYVPAWAPHGTRTDKTLPQDWVTPWEMPPP